MDRDVKQMLQDLGAKVEALRSDAYDVVEALHDDHKRADAASYIIDRLDLVTAAIGDVLSYPAASSSREA